MASYRQVSFSFGPPITRVVKALILITSAVFVLTFIPARMFEWDAPYAWFGLSPYQVTHHFFLWQVVTYLFLHGGWFHVIFNLFALWMFGSDLERQWGADRFLFYFFLTGIGAGVFDVALQPSRVSPTIGNSGAIFGLLLAYGLTFPERPILLWLIIPIKAKWFVLLMGLIEFVGTPGSGVDHIAHLGGMLFGFLYLRGRGLSYRLELGYHEWRRSRLRRKFDVYMGKHEKKDDAGRWIN